jgi:ABC-type glycerol-3-phosphate transport system substrate-binding protein
MRKTLPRLMAVVLVTLGLAHAQTLDVWVYEAIYAENAPIVQAANAFVAANPGVTVNLIPTPYGSSSYLDKYVVAALAGSGPDALMVDVAWSPQLAAMGAALPLTGKLEGSVGDYYAGPIETVLFEGEAHGLPFYTNALGLFYNKTAFEAAGLPLPTADWTWSDFLTAVDRLSNGTMYGFGLQGNWGGTYEFYPWAWSNGGDFLTADYSAPAFTSEATLEAAEFYLALITNPRYVPEAAKTWRGWSELGTAFSQGIIAMYQTGDWSINIVNGMQPAFDWGVAPMPRNEQAASLVGGANWIVNPNTRNEALAVKWIEYVTGPAVFAMMDGYNRIAARRGAEVEQAIIKDDPRMQTYVALLEVARPRPPIPAWTPIDYECLQPAFLEVILRGADIRASLAAAEICAIGKLNE